MSRKFENLGRWKEGRVGGRKEGWKEAKAGLRIAYSNQKPWGVEGWMDGRVEGWKLKRV